MIEIFDIEKVADRFWKNVTVGRCWEWHGARHKDGYGIMMLSNKAAGYPRLLMRAHRVSWELHFGALTDGQQVLHTCDNPPCVNPVHLYIGTPADNSRDKVARGRSRNGGLAKDKHPMARLNYELVLQLRLRHAGGESCASLSKEIGMRRGTVWAAIKGLNW